MKSEFAPNRVSSLRKSTASRHLSWLPTFNRPCAVQELPESMRTYPAATALSTVHRSESETSLHAATASASLAWSVQTRGPDGDRGGGGEGRGGKGGGCGGSGGDSGGGPLGGVGGSGGVEGGHGESGGEMGGVEGGGEGGGGEVGGEGGKGGGDGGGTDGGARQRQKRLTWEAGAESCRQTQYPLSAELVGFWVQGLMLVP